MQSCSAKDCVQPAVAWGRWCGTPMGITIRWPNWLSEAGRERYRCLILWSGWESRHIAWASAFSRAG